MNEEAEDANGFVIEGVETAMKHPVFLLVLLSPSALGDGLVINEAVTPTPTGHFASAVEARENRLVTSPHWFEEMLVFKALKERDLDISEETNFGGVSAGECSMLDKMVSRP